MPVRLFAALPALVASAGWCVITWIALRPDAPGAVAATPSFLVFLLALYLCMQVFLPNPPAASSSGCALERRRFRPFSPGLFSFWAAGGAFLLIIRCAFFTGTRDAWAWSGVALAVLFLALLVWDSVFFKGLVATPRSAAADEELDRYHGVSCLLMGSILLVGGSALAVADHYIWFISLGLPGAVAIVAGGTQLLSVRAADYLLISPFLALVLGTLLFVIFELAQVRSGQPIRHRWAATVLVPLFLWIFAVVSKEWRDRRATSRG